MKSMYIFYLCKRNAPSFEFIIGNRLGLDNQFPKQTHEAPLTEKHMLAEVLEKHITTKEAISFLSKAPLTNKVFYSNNRVIHNHVGDTNVHDEFWGRKYPVNQFDICDYLKEWRNKISTCCFFYCMDD